MKRDKIRTYQELINLESFEDRLAYLSLRGNVGDDTFGFDRHLNQRFYKSREWRQVRQFVLSRDQLCDLAIYSREIFERPIIHHKNPMVPEDIISADEAILNPDFLITTQLSTHNEIHYGYGEPQRPAFVERRPGDTVPWRS